MILLLNFLTLNKNKESLLENFRLPLETCSLGHAKWILLVGIRSSILSAGSRARDLKTLFQTEGRL